MNPKIKPYAEWLEGFLNQLAEHQPKKIGVVCLLDGGKSLSGFYGDVYPIEKTIMGQRLQSDGLLDEVFANAAEIVAEAQRQEEQEDDT